MPLFNFLFNTIQPRLNDQSNKRFWLPGVLENISGSNPQGKLLPITASSWPVGILSGSEGSTLATGFVTGWMAVLENQGVDLTKQQGVPDPSAPFPDLSFQDTTIEGLNNVFVGANPKITSVSDGYEFTLKLEFNTYKTLKSFSIDGNYTISQNMCTANNDSLDKCNGNEKMDLVVTGPLTAEITSAILSINGKVNINGSGATRQPSIEVTGVQIDGTDQDHPPVITVTELKAKNDLNPLAVGMWIQQAKNAVNSTSGSAGLIKNLNASLMDPNKLSQLSTALNSHISSILDSVFGQCGGNLPSDAGQKVTNPVDLYLFDRVRVAVNNSSSQWYLPSIILGVKSPELEPLSLDSISIPDQNVDGLAFTKITITNINIVGLANIIATEDNILFSNTNAVATAQIGGLSSPPKVSAGTIPAPPLTLTGNFSLMAQGVSAPITSPITVTVTTGDGVITATSSGPDAQKIVVDVQSFGLTVPPANVTIDVKIDSVFKSFINKFINTDSVKNDITGKINNAISGELAAISSEVTKAVRSGIANALND